MGGKDDGTTKFGTCVGGISTTPHISQGPGAHHHQLHNIHHLNDKPSLPILISAPRVCGVPGGPESSCGVQETCEEKRKPDEEEGRREKRRRQGQGQGKKGLASEGRGGKKGLAGEGRGRKPAEECEEEKGVE